MTRQKASAPARWLSQNGLIKHRALDYGCGKGQDAKSYNLNKYDPEFYPIPPEGKYKTIICTYVLNTLPFKVDAERVLQEIWELLDIDGVAYVTVRRDNKALKGRTQRGYQWFVMLDADIEHSAQYAFQMYRFTKSDGPPEVLAFCAAPATLQRKAKVER